MKSKSALISVIVVATLIAWRRSRRSRRRTMASIEAARMGRTIR